MNALATLRDLPLIGILRGFTCDQLPEILSAAADGGLRNLEITMNSPEAAAQIRLARQLAGGRLSVGAGTVTSMQLLRTALDAGAMFIVTPALNREVVAECVRQKIPVCPGAASPPEVYEAWELGAAMVKIFPADSFGARYLRAIRGPFPDVKLLPTGGVDLTTAPEFLRAGAAGLGVGSPLFQKARIDREDWPWLRDQTRRFVSLF